EFEFELDRKFEDDEDEFEGRHAASAMPPMVIRYDRRRVWKAAAVVTLLGTLGAALLAAGAAGGRTPLAALFRAAGLPPGAATFFRVESLTLAAALYAVAHAGRRPDRIRLLPEGIEVRDSLGTYHVRWDEIEGAGEYLGMAGIRLREGADLLREHEGTAA